MVNEMDINTAFDYIAAERKAIKELTSSLRAERERIDTEIGSLVAPHEEAMDELKEFIQRIVLGAELSVKTPNGTCTYVKGRKPTVKWDDAALHGYSIDHPKIMQFRDEGKPGDPGVRFGFVDVE